MRYLGLQLWGRIKDIQSWNSVLDLVKSRLASCQLGFLSMGGHLVLIRYVLSSIPIYHMLVSVLLKGMKRKLHGMLNRFLWGGSVDKSKLHLVKCDN